MPFGRKLRLEALERRHLLASFLVTTTSDDGLGSLRQAMLDANDNPGADIIEFNIGGGGQQTIQPLSTLPTITDAVTIDGTTQPGFSETPLIELDGTFAGDEVDGLRITAGNSVVRGLVINRFDGSGVVLEAANQCAIEGNFIGTDVSGTAARGNGKHGVQVVNGAQSNRIGTNGDGLADSAERNVISGNTETGVLIRHEAWADSEAGYSGVQGKDGWYYGYYDGNGPEPYSPSDFKELSHFEDGIWWLENGTYWTHLWNRGGHGNGEHTSGGRVPVEHWATRRWVSDVAGSVVISGTLFKNDTNSASDGITAHIIVDGQTIWSQYTAGTDGIGVEYLVDTTVGIGSVIDFALAPGQSDLADSTTFTATIDTGASRSTSNNVVAGNFIGTDVTGTLALANLRNGVGLHNGAHSNRIGTNGDGIADAAERNIISANAQHGVQLVDDGTDGNIVAGNFIGADVSGTNALGNGFGVEWGYGIWIAYGARSNLIGTNGDGVADAAERNVISANHRSGIVIQTADTDHNVVAGNYIGTDAGGTGPLGNGNHGILIGNWNGAPQANQIGTDGNGIGDDAERNVISANGRNGVVISGAGTNDNVVAGNYIGTDSSGTAALANMGDGISISDEASQNVIGTNGDGIGDETEGNVVSGNNGAGVNIYDSGTDENIVAGNLIGVDANGTSALPNGWHGIKIQFGAQRNRIGTDGDGVGDAAERNIISGNASRGVAFQFANTQENVVAGNFIGTDVTGTTPLGNGAGGVGIWEGARANRIGTDGDGIGDIAERNIISGNSSAGVAINGVGADTNVIAGNYIGTDVTGVSALPNAGNGISLSSGAQYNVIGTNGDGVGDETEGNVVSGNNGTGVSIRDAGTGENVVAGNLIGLDVYGTSALANGGHGVRIQIGAQRNRIGTNGDGVGDAAERNIISGNTSSGVALQFASTQDNVVAGNFIGTDASGTVALGNSSGVSITQGASNNTIGGLAAQERNIISASVWHGVNIRDAGTDSNLVLNNYIGTDVTGAIAIGNHFDGVVVGDGAAGNTIGGTEGAARNVISGNGKHGVNLPNSLGAANTVIGNYIGTMADGLHELGNQSNGIHIGNASGNLIGGATLGAGNLISGNQGNGVQISATQVAVFHWSPAEGGNDHYYILTPSMRWHTAEGGAVMLEGHLASITSQEEQDFINNTILSQDAFSTQGFWIGLNDEDTEGIYEWSSGEPAGFTNWNPGQPDDAGTDNGSADVVAINTLSSGPDSKGTWADDTRSHWLRGIIELEAEPDASLVEKIFGAHNNLVAGNFIGTDTTGTSALANAKNGISIGNGSQRNVIGTNGDGIRDLAERNIISGNSRYGVQITSDGTNDNVVAGNYIGTDSSGMIALANMGNGISISDGASQNVIGTDGDGVADETERNIISGNAACGIGMWGDGTSFNRIAGNFIGTDTSGERSLANMVTGIDVGNGARQNLIGTDGDGVSDLAERNLISGNKNIGIGVWGSETHSNVIAGNFIGTDIHGNSAIGNGADGIAIGVARGNTIGGTTDVARNVISGNQGTGVRISYPGASGNFVQGNFVGLDVSGSLAIKNEVHGIRIVDGASGNTVGGPIAGAGNVISGNGLHGIRIRSNLDEGNEILGNFIGTDASGMTDLGNGDSGIYISDSSWNAIGTGEANGGNLISGNGSNGIEIKATTYSVFHWSTEAGGNGHYYVLSPSTAWPNAEVAAVKLGGHLADVVDAAEQAFLEDTILADPAYSDQALWIGLTDKDEEGTFLWTSGVPFQYENWLEGEPDDPLWEDYVAINVDTGGQGQNGRWADEPRHRVRHGIIELETEPDASLLEGVFGAHENSVAGNTIMANVADGVQVTGDATGNHFTENAIYDNGGLGVNLVGGDENENGVSQNDIDDTDTGPNGLQNFPVISAAQSGTATRVQGTFSSLPDTLYTIEFYANQDADASGFGEGQRWLDSILLTTDSLGTADFDTFLTAETVSGERITATATDPGGSSSEFSAAVVAIIDLGVVDFLEIPDEPLASGGLWYRLETTRAGFLTVVAAADTPVELALYADDWTEPPVTASATPGAEQRIDEEVAAAAIYFVRVSGTAADVDITIANLVSHAGASVTVSGTAAADTFGFSTTAAHDVTINGVAYQFEKVDVNEIAFDGGSGDDTAELNGGSGDEIARLFPDHGTFGENGFLVTVNDVTTITAFGGGGQDAAFMYDSPGDDEFISRRGYGKLSGDGFALETFDFMLNYGYATTADGGTDVARMDDTPGNDKFKFDWPKPGQFFGKMYGGGQYYNRAKYFEQIDAVMTDGKNVVRLYDSDGDDTFYGQKDESRLVGAHFDLTVTGYDSLIAYASKGTDIAYLEDSDDDDTTRARPHKIILWGGDDADPTYEITARKFDEYHFAGGHAGFDRAKLHDTALNDHVDAVGDSASFYKNDGDLDLLYDVVAFEWVKLYATDNDSHGTLKKEDPLDFDLVYDPTLWEEVP